jgi:ABC-2 type transport system permease protein
MNRLVALIRREYWENKGAFRTTPLVIGGIYIAFLLMSIFTTAHFDNEMYTFREAVRLLAEQPAELRARHADDVLLGSSLFFTVVLAFVVFFYLLGSLYDDRKDRSILFWKSLPTSDTLTVASKLLSAMVLAPVIFWAVFVVTQIVMGLIASVMVLSVGENPWTLFLSVVNPFKPWLVLLISYLAASVWFLPIYGWLLLVSALAPRIPLLFAVLPPVVFSVLQIWIDFLRTFTLDSSLFGIIGEWVANSPAILSAGIHEGRGGLSLGFPVTDDFDHAVTLGNIFARIFSLEMLAGLAAAAVLLAATLWARRRATDS